jgi:hypothetical protein
VSAARGTARVKVESDSASQGQVRSLFGHAKVGRVSSSRRGLFRSLRLRLRWRTAVLTLPQLQNRYFGVPIRCDINPGGFQVKERQRANKLQRTCGLCGSAHQLRRLLSRCPPCLHQF